MLNLPNDSQMKKITNYDSEIPQDLDSFQKWLHTRKEGSSSLLPGRLLHLIVFYVHCFSLYH